jgi:hypothetical protein
VFRRHWYEPRFWRWWWQNRTSPVVRAVAPWLLLLLLVGGGFLVADRLTAAHAGAETSIVIERTVQRVVTVREQGKVVKKLVPVVRRIRVRARPTTEYRARTLFQTQVVTTPGGVRVVTKPVVRLVPKVETTVVTQEGAPHTVTQTRVVPTTRVRTATVTAERTVTNTAVQTQTVSQTRTVIEPRTVTDTATVQRTVTSTVTETQPGITITLPVQTVIVTVTVPAKH